MNKKDFAKGIKTLELTYNQKFDEEKRNFWYRQLEDLDTDKFYRNIQEIIKNNKYMPNIAEIRDGIKVNLNNINLNSSYWYINLRQWCDENNQPYYDITTGKPLPAYK